MSASRARSGVRDFSSPATTPATASRSGWATSASARRSASGTSRGTSGRSASRAALDAPLVYQPYSRLVIDANRDPVRADSIPLRSEATDVPGNKGLTQHARELRRVEIFEPYHAAIRAELDARAARGVDTLYVSVHSFTPVYLGDARRWQAGVLWRSDRAFAELLLEGLRREPGLEVGDNQPYSLQSDVDYSVPVHADTRGLSNVLLEIRQDEITSEAQQAAWANRLLPLLHEAAAVLHGTRKIA